MSTLVNIFMSFNQQVYGKRTGVPKKVLPKFEEVERMLTHADINLEDYALTTFTERIWIAQQVGHLPANVFISKQSLEHYVTRLEQGCEVTRKKPKQKTEDELKAEAYARWIKTPEGQKALADTEAELLASGKIKFSQNAQEDRSEEAKTGFIKVKDEHEANEREG